MLNIYLLQRTESVERYEAHGFVIRAVSEGRARELAKNNRGAEDKFTWMDTHLATCRNLGKADVAQDDDDIDVESVLLQN